MGGAKKSGSAISRLGDKTEKFHAWKAPLERVMAMGSYLAGSPVATGANAVLNATQNFGAGAVNQYLGTQDDLPGPEAVKAGMHAVTHPGEGEANLHSIERHAGLPVAGDKANIGQRIGQAVEDIGVGSAVDPATVVPGLDVVSVGRRAFQVGKPVLEAAHLAAPIGDAFSKVANPIGHFVNASHDLRQIVNREGQNIVEGMKKAGHSTEAILSKFGQVAPKEASLGQKDAEIVAMFDRNHPVMTKELQQQRKDLIRSLEARHPKTRAGELPKVARVEHSPYLLPNKTVKDLGNYLRGQVPGYETGLSKAMSLVAKHSPLRKVSDIRRDSLFVLPFAHMKNLTILALLGAKNGAQVVTRGIGYMKALANPTPAIEKRLAQLKEMGADISYQGTADHGELYSQSWLHGIKGIGKLSDWSNKTLERYDMALRLSLLDELKARGITGFNAGGEIRDIMGGGDPSEMVKLLRAMGANFPAWGLGVVPRAMGKALRDQPHAAKMYARTNAAISGDVTQPMIGSDFDLAGPAEDATKGALAPAAFLASPSRMGVPADLELGRRAYQKGGGPFLEFLGEEAAGALPFSGLAESAANWPHKSVAPEAARVGANVAGSYFTDAPNALKRAVVLKRMGLTQPEVMDELRREGLVADPARK